MGRLSMYTSACILFVLLFMASCINNDFDTDKFNKDGSFLIPPVPLGNIDTIWIDGLPEVPIPPVGIEVPQYFEIEARREIISDLFTKDILDKFFNEKAKGDVRLESVADISIMTKSSGLEVKVAFEVADYNGEVIEEVKIPSQTLVYGEGQMFTVQFPQEYFKYMKNAKDLNLIFVIKAQSINITNNDYALLRNVVLKSGGIHFEF